MATSQHAEAFLPDKEWKLCALQWKDSVLTSGSPGTPKAEFLFFFKYLFIYLAALGLSCAAQVFVVPGGHLLEAHGLSS